MRLLVVGGAAFIGSHMVKLLITAGHNVLVFDNLSSGHHSSLLGGDFVQGDLADPSALNNLFEEHRFDTVFQFASSIEVGESLKNSAKYYRNNFSNTQNLMDAMVKHHVKRLVFSSTAVIFGEPAYTPIDEDHDCRPVNPYGASKLMVEQALKHYDYAYDFKSICLRYFNAAGADSMGEIGECHEAETHLIPLLLQVASGRRDHIKVFGRDYETPEGTCIRDYVNVQDLCYAHLLGLDYLIASGKSNAYNLGNGRGFSVQEVIATVERITGQKIKTEDAPRRAGDPIRLVANSAKSAAILGWKPGYAELDTIVAHAWAWEKKLTASAPWLGLPARPGLRF